ncbi:MAG: hypothetical protein P9L92_05345 [Candidatus Electryonea clarkiae]|nr:hypothetical protein [Candidatus Electryonea clarkiae]
MSYKTIVVLFIVAVILTTASICTPAYGQTGSRDKVVCEDCGYSNNWSSKFCIRCGESLAEEKRDFGLMDHAPRIATLEVGMSKSFHLTDGNIITGNINKLEGDSIAVIETPDGVLKIPTRMILDETADITKQDDSRAVGPVLSEDEYSISIKTPYGVVVILKKDVKTMDRYYGDKKISWTEEKKRFHSAEVLTDIFSDPTAFPLQPHTVYLSGLSLGYGFTENFMLRTRFGQDFTGDMNLHPLFRIFNRNKGTTEWSLAIGAELYNHHLTKNEAQKYSHWIQDTTGTTITRLDEEGARNIEEVLLDKDKKEFFWNVYIVLSSRKSLASGRGKWGWHIGAKTNSLLIEKPDLKYANYAWDDDKFLIPYRTWIAMDYDLAKNLKFLIEVFADNGHKFITFSDAAKSYFDNESPFTIETQEGEYQPVDLDFGFLYSLNESFRFGVHFQSPYLAFYWKW